MFPATDRPPDYDRDMARDSRRASFDEVSSHLDAGERRHPGSRRRLVVGRPGGATDDVFLLDASGTEVVSVASTGPALLAAVEHFRPDLVLLHAHLPGANRRLPATVHALCGAPTILLVPASLRSSEREENLLLADHSQAYPAALLAEAERIGCPFVATWPADPAELRMATTQALALAHVTTESRPSPTGQRRGRVIVVRSDKGGVGKSGFAINLACALGVRGGRRVLLIDLDIAGASLHTLLGLAAVPGRGLEALHGDLRGWPEGEPFDLEPYVVAYPPHAGTDDGGDAETQRETTRAAGEGYSHLHVLIGPPDPGAAKRLAVDEPVLDAVLKPARQEYDDVVVDVGTDVTSPHHLLCCSRAEWVLIVVEPTDDALTRCAGGQKQVMNTTGISAARCRLIVNRVADVRGELVLEDIRARFGDIGVLGLLPEDTRRVRRSMSAHLPWILSVERADRHSALVRAMEQIVNRLTPGLLPALRPSLLARLLRGEAGLEGAPASGNASIRESSRS